MTAAPVLFELDGWQLARLPDIENDEPRVPAAALGEKLGFTQARDIRKIVKRMIDAGKLPGVHVRATVARTSMPRGGTRDVTVDEYFLSEPQTLKVIAKSETDIADKILDEIIAVYVKVRKGLLGPSHAQQIDLQALAMVVATSVVTAMAPLMDRMNATVTTSFAEAMAKVNDRLDDIENAEPYEPFGVAGSTAANFISRQLHTYAAIVGETKEDRKRARGMAEVELRSALRYSGPGASWTEMPMQLYSQARVKLAGMIHRAKKLAGMSAANRQQTFPFPDPDKPRRKRRNRRGPSK